mmetsp:Transcript_98439/g.175319  ORF Transcript_98439/g.175319 Transcript_98439/m.175319 type:complete len:209 (+) Transcript_98439:522-1148(+)
MEVMVLSLHTRSLFLPKVSFSAFLSVSARRHSEQSTTFAADLSIMWRKAFMAAGKKSEVSGFASPSVEMSKEPARAGRKTPSTSRKTILLGSSGGKAKSAAGTAATAFMAASAAAAPSVSGCGMSEYSDSASLAALAAARSACCFFAASTLALTRWSRVSASFFMASSASAISFLARSRLSFASSALSLSRASFASCSAWLFALSAAA